NSTLSGNTAMRNGAGLYADGGQIQLFNATIAGNQVVVPNGTADAGLGGGLYISPTAVLTANSTIIAGNTHHYGFWPTELDDCYGSIHPYITNIIQTTTGCTFTGITLGNILGQDPLLGALQFNSVPTPTRSLLPG